jgi:hypothetical protein
MDVQVCAAAQQAAGKATHNTVIMQGSKWHCVVLHAGWDAGSSEFF